MKIAVDFDGTIVKHRFPYIGEEVPEAFQWLKRFQHMGAELFLWTVRGPDHQQFGDGLTDAVEFCRSKGIEFAGINHNPNCAIKTGSPKIHADVFIDDAALGCPLVTRIGEPPYVDWTRVGPRVAALINRSKW